MRLLFDTETDGLLDQLTRIHCIVARDVDTGDVFRFNDQHTPGTLPVADGVRLLMEAAELIAHNAIEFDIPALTKVYPWFKPRGRILDTIVCSRLIYTDIKDRDFKHIKSHPEFPGKLIGRHSLEAWGYRLGNYKGDFDGPWDQWTQEMEDYCEQDVSVLCSLHKLIVSKQYSQQAIELEHAVASIIFRQQQYGFAVSQKHIEDLYVMLAKRRLALDTELRDRYFHSRFLRSGRDFTPKKDSKQYGYVEGAPLCKVKLTEFNPSSRDHIALWLGQMYGWKPTEFTDDGGAKVDETILSALSYPPAKLLVEYFTVDKRIGQIAEGKKAWMKFIKNGRIHGRVITNGAVTGRMTHSDPNVAQTPKADERTAYGYECRECWVAPPGKVLVGCDAAALELRDLAGYMARYDDGAYIKIVLEGKKEDGSEIHSVNMRALQITSRDVAKTWFYAWLYGAGDYKLGLILLDALEPDKRPRGEKAITKYGREKRAAFEKNLPALGRLVEEVKAKAKSQGWLRGLDGRRLHVRSEHAALNTLLQSAGAVQMKQALVILDADLQAFGLVPGVDYEFVANIHDEWQIEVSIAFADKVGQMAERAIRKAGEHFNFLCPLAGEYKIGSNWAETH